MKALSLSMLLAFAIGLAGTAGASATIDPGIGSKRATDISSRLRLAAKGCREECDQNGNNCRQVCQ